MRDDPDETVRMHVAGALGEIGLPGGVVIPALTRALRDPSSYVRHRAMTQFAFTITPTDEVLPVLKELAKDKDRGVSGLAQSALNSPLHRSDNRAETYVMMLRTGSARDYTLRQLALMGPKAASAVPALIPLLIDRSSLNRFLTAEALGAIGPGAKDALPALAAASKDEDPVVRESAAEAIAAIKGGPQP
jgi:HEAT repeat protein